MQTFYSFEKCPLLFLRFCFKFFTQCKRTLQVWGLLDGIVTRARAGVPQTLSSAQPPAGCHRKWAEKPRVQDAKEGGAGKAEAPRVLVRFQERTETLASFWEELARPGPCRVDRVSEATEGRRGPSGAQQALRAAGGGLARGRAGNEAGLHGGELGLLGGAPPFTLQVSGLSREPFSFLVL